MPRPSRSPGRRVVFIDTEFTDLLPRQLAHHIRLISFGACVEDGDETFYAEVDGWTPEQCGDFARQHVLPLLEGAEAQVPFRELPHRLRQWLESLGADVEILATSQYDIEFLNQAYSANHLPLPRCVHSALVFALTDFGGDAGMKAAREEETYLLEDGRRHHALVDALALRAGYRTGVLAFGASPG